MISKIRLNNYQSHHDNTFILSPGVNIIIGKSDSGKSAIVRGVNLVVNNKPQGTSYITKGKKISVVEIEKDGNDIKRIRSKSKNMYTLNENEYKAMGTGVPEDISEAINFCDINFQYQMDSSFLLSKNSSEVSRYLNKIVNLDIIDSALTKVESKRRTLLREIEVVEQSIQRSEIELSELPDVEMVDRLLTEVEKKKNIYTSKKNKYSIVDKVINDIKKYQKELDEIPDLPDIDSIILKIDKKLERLNEHQGKYTDIKKVKNHIKKLDERLLEIKEEVMHIEDDLKKLNIKECPLCGKPINSCKNIL